MFELSWSRNKINKSEFILDSEKLPIKKASFLFWEEHCVECSAPDCYSSCPLFIRRIDQRCARFKNGISKISRIKGGDGYAVEIIFRKWAKLQTEWPFNPKTYKIWNLRKLTTLINYFENFSKNISTIISFINKKRYLSHIFLRIIHKIFSFISSTKIKKDFEKLDGFLVEFFSFNNENNAFLFEIFEKTGKVYFRRRFSIRKGWNRYFVPIEEVPFGINNASARLWNEKSEDLKIIIKWLHLVEFNDDFIKKRLLNNPFQSLKIDNAEEKKEKKKYIKCVVFDLDNTLWDGVIGDDGINNTKIKKEYLEFIYELDKRGIMCSIASKNEYSVAWEKIKYEKLEDYFLFPQICWKPKSESLYDISLKINIGLDAIAFIDDNIFEREEVKNRFPEIRVYSQDYILDLLKEEEFNPKQSIESPNRRKTYLTQNKRNLALKNSHFSADQFLLKCNMVLELMRPEESIDRCFELISRSNQFNISGKNYEIIEFQELLQNSKSFCYKLKDNFGDYGVVGFFSLKLDNKKFIMTDYVMSCRVAEKRVEEAIFSWLIHNYICSNDLEIKFIKTKRNEPIKNKFLELGMKINSEDDEKIIFNTPVNIVDQFKNVIKVNSERLSL